jgi:hypothetical protein
MHAGAGARDRRKTRPSPRARQGPKPAVVSHWSERAPRPCCDQALFAIRGTIETGEKRGGRQADVAAPSRPARGTGRRSSRQLERLAGAGDRLH